MQCSDALKSDSGMEIAAYSCSDNFCTEATVSYFKEMQPLLDVLLVNTFDLGVTSEFALNSYIYMTCIVAMPLFPMVFPNFCTLQESNQKCTKLDCQA